MAKLIQKRFTDEQVKDFMKRYENGEISRVHVERILGIGQTRFFALIKSYRNNSETFSVNYRRRLPARRSARKLRNASFKSSTHPKNLSTRNPFPSGGTTTASFANTPRTSSVSAWTEQSTLIALSRSTTSKSNSAMPPFTKKSSCVFINGDLL